jgi:hypothetical protein
MVAEPEVSTPLVLKSAIGHDPEPVPSIFHPHNLFPYDPPKCCLTSRSWSDKWIFFFCVYLLSSAMCLVHVKLSWCETLWKGTKYKVSHKNLTHLHALYTETRSACVLNRLYVVRFQVLTAASMKFRVFWDILPCSQIDVDRSFRGACCLHCACEVGR